MSDRDRYFDGIQLLPLGSPKRSFELAVNMGRIPGYTVVDKYGENPLIPAAGEADVWEGGGLYNYDPDGTAPIQYLSSDDALDTGQTISIAGLDIDGNAVTQTAVTTGLTAVTLGTPLWRVFRVENDSATGLDLTGILYCGTEAAPVAGIPALANQRAIITNGNNQTLMALYTVPVGKVGFLYLGEIGAGLEGGGGTTSEFARMSYISRRLGKVPKVKKRVKCSINGDSNYQNKRSFPDVIPAMTDLGLRAEFVSAEMSVWGAFDILLIDEKFFPDSYLQAIGQPGF